MLDTDIAAALNADSALAGYLPGRIWDRALKRRGPFATPEAFAQTAPHNVLPAAVVSNSGQTRDYTGAPGAYTGYVTIWFHAPEGFASADMLDAAAWRVMQLVNGTQWKARDGSGIWLEAAERYGVRDDPVIDGTQIDYIRFLLAGLFPVKG
jgi:hypothetical protein